MTSPPADKLTSSERWLLFLMREVGPEPERALRQAVEAASLRYFLACYRRFRPAVLRSLYVLWRDHCACTAPGTVPPFQLEASVCSRWATEFRLPDTPSLVGALFETFVFFGVPRDAPPERLRWGFEQASEPLYLPRDFGLRQSDFVLRIPGWNPEVESIEDARKRAQTAFTQRLSDRLALWRLQEACLQAVGPHRLALAQTTTLRRNLCWLALYQAKSGVSMAQLARKRTVSVDAVRKALHQAATLVGLPPSKLAHARRGRPRKTPSRQRT